MSKPSTLSITNSRFGTDLVISYGPTPGGGFLVWFSNGVSRRHRRREGHREHVDEAAVGRVQLDGDLARLVVGRDAGDVASASPASMYSVAPFDALEEVGTARLEVQHALDRVLEVARLDGRAVGVLQAVAELEAVGLAVLGDLRQRLGDPRDQLTALGALGTAVSQRRGVGEPERLPGVPAVGERRVQRVGLGPVRDRDRSALVATGRLVVVRARRSRPRPPRPEPKRSQEFSLLSFDTFRPAEGQTFSPPCQCGHLV